MIYLKDGNIPLNLAYDDDIVQEANSSYQLSFKFPLTDGKWNLLKREVFLLADDLHGEQEFFIFEVKKVNGYVQVYAKQVATLLNYYSINTISVDRVPGQTAMTALAGSIKRNCPFTFFSDIMDRHTFNESNVSVMDALAKDKHSIVGQWGGDLVRDKYQVKLLKNGGIENESLFMYKKNLSSYEESENINNLKTRLHLKKTIQGQSEGEADRVIAVTVDSPLISQYRQIYEADIEVNDQDVIDEASLLAYGKRYFSSTLCDLVENSINLDVKGKSDVSVKMFDTVSVFHERFDVDLRLKITSYHFGPMSKRLKSIGFGKVSQTFGSTVAGMVAGSVDKATNTLSASFEQKLQKEIDNANRHFDAEFEKRVEEINDGIEQSRAEAERHADNIKRSIDTEIAQVNQSMQAQSEEHDRQVADILSKAQSVESLANQAKADAASALARANQVKTEAIADARAQVATVSQALNTAKSELQTAIASADQKARDSQASATALRNDLNLQASKILEQARAQTALTNRVSTVETLADGTRSTVAELSKTVSKATGDIASVTSRTKTVEDTLSQTRTQYEALTQTVNTQTGQIESINRKTADLQSGIDGVTERFESLRIEDNLLLNSSFNQNLNQWQETGVTIVDGKARITGEFNKTKYIYQSIKSQIANDDVSQVYIASISVKVTNYVAGRNPFFALYIDGRKNDSRNTQFGGTYLTANRLDAVNNRGVVQFATTFRINVPRNQIKSLDFYIYARDFTGEVEFEKVSLRRGDIDLGWQPSPEDLRSEIASYKRTADEASAELSHQIQTVDGKAVDAKTYAQQTATAINTRLESLETYKNEEGTRAEQYLSASRTETAKQLSAERTVISANYVAKSTFEENARGVTEKFENLRVGGTNLLSLSKAVKGFYKFTKGENVPSAHYAYGIPIAVDNKARYVLQAWSRTINDFSWIGAIQLNNEGRMIDNSYLSIYPSKTSLYFKRDISILPNAKYIQFSFSNDVLGDDPNLKIQFEKGSLPTDYKMAEEDQQSYADTKIAEYRNTVEETSAELSRQIQLADGKAVEAKTYAQQTTDAIKTRLESLETYKNEEGTRAEQYLSASRTETAKQLSAERTVISANYVAKSTFEENARGVTEKFENLRVGGTNLLSLSKAVKGFYKFTKGENVPSAHYAYGIPIAVDNKARYVLQAWSRTINDFSWIGAIQLNNEGRMIDNSYLSIHPSKTSLYFKRDISILPNAKYIQFSFSNDVLGDDPNLKIQFEKGSLPTDYKMAEEDQQSYADTKIAEYRNTVDGRFATLQSQKANQVDLQTVRETANLYERIIGSTETGIKDKVARMVMTDSLFLTEVKDKISGTATQVSQLNNSYAIKNLTSAGTVLNQINLLANGTNRIDGRLTHITGQTLIDNGVIKNAMIGSLDAGKITSGYLSAARIATNSIDGSKMVFDQAFVNKMTANEALFKQLFAKNAFITSVQAVTLSASQITGGLMRATNRAMEVNLNAGQILYYTDQAALKRVLNGYPTQFVKFATGTVTGKGNAGVTVIGSNRWNSESSNDGGFVGIRAWNGANIDQIDVVGDTVRLASSAFEAADGWNINTLPGKLDIDAFNADHRASSKIKVGDLWLWKNATTYSSMRDTINLIIDNLQLLHNNKSTERGYSYTLPAKV